MLSNFGIQKQVKIEVPNAEKASNENLMQEVQKSLSERLAS
jgi:hypothetical protein